ncbi:MAG: hypothetical protein VX902_01090 [Planctomycetota bacterium]|nr:hypothetical protein [Planctomycetota bacterium]
MKWVVASVLCGLIGSSIAIASQPTKGDQPVEDVVTLSSIQFATHFELMKKMLEGEWDEKVYQQFSYYDGLVYEVIKKYENTYQDDAVWGPFLKKRVDVHTQIFKEMQPLIKKRQDGERLSNKEQLWLESAGQKIWEELVR